MPIGGIRRSYDNLDIIAALGEMAERPLDGHPGDTSAHQSRHLRLVHAQHGDGLPLGQALLAYRGQQGCLEHVGVAVPVDADPVVA